MREEIYDECVPFGQEDWNKIVKHAGRVHSLFERAMYGEFLGPTPEQKLHAQIAREYHESCDAYDGCICSGVSPRSGEPMPITLLEHGLISEHARQVRRRLMGEYSLTDKQFHEIITAHNR